MKGHYRYLIVFLILGIICFSPVFAIDKVISNSADWKDVYSSMLYASLIDKKPGLFLTSSKHGSILLYSVPKESDGILITSSRSQPYIVNYKGVLDSQGYSGVEELVSNNINLDLARRLSNENVVNKYIVVDDAYGYNALSAASYAVVDKFYIIFANERNIGQVDSFFGQKTPDKIIILGQVDESVKTRLAKYSPEVINTGDRFDNNIEIVKKYQQVKGSRQMLMSNGEFIEASIMSGDDPVIFIGRGTVPDQVKDYIKDSGIQVAVLIGNELINSATNIRRDLGISVFVKFAQGSRTPTGAIATVEDLDKFAMPRYLTNIQIYSILYNKATNQLWVTYRNTENTGAYLKGTITINADGQTFVVGDQDLVFIDKNQYKTLNYDIAALEGNNITAKIYTIFGEGKRSLENILEATATVETVTILDEADVNLTSVAYDKSNDRFILTVENTGTVESYVSAELIDLYVNEEYLTISSTSPILLKPGEVGELIVEVELSDIDIENNPVIKARIYYGQRENALIRTKYGEYQFKFKHIDVLYYVLIAAVIILLLLILFGRKKCPHCKARNSRLVKKCRKCGQNLYIKKE